MPKYLLLDHNGVLGGDYSENDIGEDDLVLQDGLDKRYPFEVLRKGVNLVNNLNELVSKYDYKIAFSSSNPEADQIRLLENLQKACRKKGIKFPPVAAMFVCDPGKYPEIESYAPRFEFNAKHHIQIAKFGEKNDELKTDGRIALSTLLMNEEPSNFLVFDDNKDIVAKAISEKCLGFEVIDQVEVENDVSQRSGSSRVTRVKKTLNDWVDEIAKVERADVEVQHNQSIFQHHGLYSTHDNVIPDPNYKIIQDLKINIDKELTSRFCLNRNRKMHKSNFLGKVLKAYEDNPAQPIQLYLNYFKIRFPKNYEEAIAGRFSKRTKDVFETILSISTPRLR